MSLEVFDVLAAVAEYCDGAAFVKATMSAAICSLRAREVTRALQNWWIGALSSGRSRAQW